MPSVYINKREKEAIHDAYDYVNNLLEGCTADPDTAEGKLALKGLFDTLAGLRSIERKI
ncbi:hypothetical protein [Aquimarina mytili]|uniref:Uncharacterized protein n=1 Tax=Aquimarina mytili TaxID=874423 RepID=A0A937DAI8_9FLAO|nr:hypothetical protein [Aquimarina mytili]MBL0686050.1 hypothetical protein [Aquimarina mytili]